MDLLPALYVLSLGVVSGSCRASTRRATVSCPPSRRLAPVAVPCVCALTGIERAVEAMLASAGP